MSYEVKQPSVGASFGAGLGSGLSEQIPREVERYRLSSGLKRFADESQGLDPMQAMARLSAIPGMTPQMIQSMGDLLKMRAYGSALRQRTGQGAQKRGDATLKRQGGVTQEGQQPEQRREFLDPDVRPSDIPSLVDPRTVEAGINPEIPATEEEIRARAQELPIYDMDPDRALAIVRQEDQSRVARNENLQKAGAIQEAQQNKISSGLRGTAERFGGVGPQGIPENVYMGIENEAIDAVANKKMNPDQAAKFFSKKIEQIGRDYLDTKGLGNWLMAWGNPKSTKNNLQNLQSKFEKRGDLRNWRDTLVANNGLSWPMASSMAYPVQKNRNLYGYLRDVPKIDFLVGQPPTPERQATIFNDILKKMDDKTSPLSIAQYLQRKGYDHTAFLEELMQNRDDLKGWQIDELSKPFPSVPKMNDLWIMSVTGIN